MFVMIVNQTELLQLGARRWPAEKAATITRPTADTCVLVWYGDLNLVPDALVVLDGMLEPFFAWISTYAPHLSPLTGILEVIEYSNFGTGRSSRRRRGAAPAEGFRIRGGLGLVLAEAVAGFRGAHPPSSAGLTPYISTYSWLALQHQHSKVRGTSFAIIRERWEEARVLLGAASLGYVASDVEEVWVAIAESSDGNAELANVVTLLSEPVPLDAERAKQIPLPAEHISALLMLQEGPLEKRVQVFTSMLSTIFAGQCSNALAAVILGFALSCISQGSFAHGGMLTPARVPDVRALLWYGWFNFVRYEPTAGSSSTSAVTLQLLVRLMGSRRPDYAPQISLEELRVLSRDEEPFDQSLLDMRHPLAVELVPGVTCVIQPSARPLGHKWLRS